MFLSIALIAIKVLFSIDFYVDARDLCLSITYEGKCCSIANSHIYSTCWKSGEEFLCNSNKPCSRRFPGFQSAQPLGMTSGLIGNNQFVVPDKELKAKRARELWTVGWPASNTYVNSHSDYFTSIGSVSTFPSSVLQSAPVFFQIDFMRMKTVRYLLAGATQVNTNGDRTFALSYRNVDGKSIVYVDNTSPAYVQKWTCSSIHTRRDCRFKVNPFRARSLRIVAIDYKNTERLFFEVGGLDYLEADNQWTLDNVTRTISDIYYHDERGGFPLKTNQVIPSSYSGPDAGLVTTVGAYFYTEVIGMGHCYANPTICPDGLSIAFWFKVGGAPFSIVGTGAIAPSDQYAGFNVQYEDSAKMNVALMLTTIKYSMVYNIPRNGWHHFLITWSQVSGLLLYEDGTRVAQGTKGSTPHSVNWQPKIFVGHGTVNNGTQLHDLRLWQFRLSEVDAKNVFSPSKVDAAQMADYINKFRPMDCLEAIAAYGNKSGMFDIHRPKGSVTIRCIPVMNGAKFYFLPTTPSVNVSQPWVDGSFQQVFEYDYRMDVMRYFIERASSCRQTISYSCLAARISSNSRPCDKDGNNWAMGCEGASCNCDDVSQYIMRHDKQHFVDRNKLPLGRIIINSVSTINSSLAYTVGPVECFQDNHVYKSCKDALDKNSRLSGTYRIATPNKIIMVLCEFDGGTYKSVFRHADSGKNIKISGFEPEGSYARQIVYNEDFPSIVAIVGASDSCEQKIEATCRNAIITNHSWFTDRGTMAIPFWAGGQTTGCKCRIDNSCDSPSKICNCDKNDNVVRYDHGTYTDKSLLPLTGVRVGDTGGADEYLQLKIGDLVCSGSNDVGSSSSPDCPTKLRDGSCISSHYDDGCTDEIDENGCCSFPFTYRGVSYANCSLVDSKFPWCSFDSTYSGKWRYCIKNQAKADIDFIGNLEMDDFGEWKIGSDCNGEDSSGPCYDMSASSRPSEKVSIFTQQYFAKKVSHSSYSQSNFQCQHNQFKADVKGSLTAIQFELKDINRPTTLSKAFYKFRIGYVGFTAIVHVYSAVDPVGGDQYIEKCRYAYFRTGLHFGPIIWRLEVTTSAQQDVVTPDLKEIVLPILRSSDVTTNQNLYLVFEWKEFITGDVVNNNHHYQFQTHMQFEYKEKQPGNYLYADSLDAKGPGTALSYHTRHFPPSKKCLQFWYHMQNVGDAVLIVNLNQKGSASREILKIFGHQGNSWKKATVPIGPYLNSGGHLFKVIFDAIRGTKIYRSIAIDDISFLDDVCILQPQLSYPLAGNLPKARLILTLRQTLADASNSASSVKKTSNPDEVTEDPFGYQLHFGAFGNGASRAVPKYSQEFRVSADFSICFHIKSYIGYFFKVFSIHEFLTLSYNMNGFLQARFHESGAVWVSNQTMSNGTWCFFCLVYTQHLEILKVFYNGQLSEELDIGYISQKIPKSNISIGPSNYSLRLFLSCVQFYEEALDDDFIPALELCPDRHLRDACKENCRKGSICNPLTGKCVCPSYANRFVTADCGNALESIVYNGNIEYISFDNKTEAPWKFYRSIAEVHKRSRNTSSIASSSKFLLIPGPVNVGLCVNSSSETIKLVPTASCLSTGTCSDGSSLALWILAPPVLNWTIIGNVTLMEYGKLEISYGLVNDRRNGTTKPIPSLMFSVAQSGEKCLWVSMIYGSMITNSWAHIVVTIDATNSLRVYYNGKENDVKKASCQPHIPQAVYAFSSGSLSFTCMDELVLWNHVLVPEVVEHIYNATTFGGGQAVQSKINFRRLYTREPDDLWAIDQSNTLYKYHHASWIPLPEMKIREVASGGTGFFAVSWNNSLWRREGISSQNPTGTKWQSVSTSIMLKGAITDIQTVSNGHLHAKSAYQWHCIKVASADNVKTVSEIMNAAYSQLSCTVTKCWSMKKNADDFIAAETSANNDCTMGNQAQMYTDPPIKRIGSSFNAVGPLAIRKSDGQLLERTSEMLEWLESNSKINLVDLIGFNGQAIGVTHDGKIEFIKRGSDAFLIRSTSVQNVCMMLYGDRFRFKLPCKSLFVLREDLCILHLESNRILHFKHDKIALTDFCSEDDKMILNKDGTVKRRNGLDCVVGCITDNCDPKISSSPTPGQCIVFSFVKVGSVKNIPSHNLIWNGTNLTHADVKVDIKVTFHLYYPRWTSQLAQPNGKEFKFFCKRIENEMQQLFAGNINYRSLECQKFEKTKCSSVTTERCQFSMYTRLSFAHIDESIRVLLHSKKMADEMTDCNGLMCTIALTRRAIGVDFNPQTIKILQKTPSAATIQIQRPDNRIVAETGYRVSAVGKSAYENNLRTMYMEFVSRDGNTVSVNNAAGYFNYSCEAVPLFMQGIGYAVPFSFQTKEDVPSKSPSIKVTDSQRNSIEITMTEIPTTEWNGSPRGYRIYYQRVLQLKQLGNLEISYVTETYNHINFTVNVDFTERGNFSYPITLRNLEMFSNYSILAAAYSGAGLGPFSHTFWRTNQGEPEVPPGDFRVHALNSTHLKASWSMTDDIELLNGWFLSNYSVKYHESSIPSLAANGSMVLNRSQSSVIIGPLDPWREYTVSVAGNVESRPGVFASLCVRTDEDVPTQYPSISQIGTITASTINYTTGCLHLSHEHGVILYYNISATIASSSRTEFYLASITSEKCTTGSSCFPGRNDSCPLPGGSTPSPETYTVSHNCSSNGTQMSRTSSLVYHVLDQLQYWTVYDIRVAACTRKGCGPFSTPLSTQTREHSPTCYPNASAVQNTSSTSLHVSWLEIPISCAHGTILNYYAFISPPNELTGDECFNDTSCWQTYSPGATKFYQRTEDLSLEFTGLKKYWRYCVFLQAENIEGRGPTSYGVCNYTAEDEPEGPPASFNATTNSSRGLIVILETPARDVVNGIIRGYHVFYHMADKDGIAIGNEMMADIKRTDEKTTIGLIDNLEEFTWYRLTARAYTSIGYGPNTTDFRLVRTLEDVPSGPPRNQEIMDIQSNSFVFQLDQPLPLDMNGVFTEFKINLIENCRNGSVFEYEFYTVASNASADEVTEGNNTSAVALNGSSLPARRRRRSLTQDLANQATNQVTDTAQSGLQAVQNIVNTTVNNVGNLVNGSIINILQNSASRGNSSAKARMNVTDLRLGLTNRASFTGRHTSFEILITGLLPYTFYNLSAAACNNIGCGPLAHSRERTDQRVPSGVPQPHLQANKTLDSLAISWNEVPIMERRGAITGYTIKWMKNCEYLRLMNIPEMDDCRRVIPENTTNFATQEVGSNPRKTLVASLDPYTWYRFEFCAKTMKGLGPCSNITYQTDETTPCEAPNVTSTTPVTGKSFRIEWDDVAMPCQRGIIIGYVLFYQLTSLLQDKNSTRGVSFESTNTTKNSILIDDLALKSNFSVKIAAYTSKGVGVNSSIFYAMTGDFKHGNWSEWSQWSYCSESCGGGINIRYRQCDNPAPFNGGDYCTGSNNDTKPCNQFRCSGPLLGNVSQSCAAACKAFNMICSTSFPLTDPLKMYAAEGRPCVDKTSDPTYSQLYHPSYDTSSAKCEGFRDMPSMINCTQHPPNDGKTMRLCNCVSLSDCGCQEWAEWSLCSKPKCGGGTKTRKRECTALYCGSSSTVQKTECNTNPCPIDGNWGQWSDITPCNKSCGYGYRHRYRECNDPAPNYGGNYCRGTHVDVIPECNVQQCPVHGNWGNWGEWRVCNRICGGGLSIRRKYCDSPAPKYGGKYCEGEDSEGVPCNMHECEGIRVRFAVKLVDFQWSYYLVYNDHPEALQIAAETRLNVRAVYNYSSIINAVDILNFVKGSVVANFTIYYVQVSDSQVLLLQDYIAATGKMNNLSTVLQEAVPMEVVAEPPHSLNAQSFNHNSMLITWQPPDNVDKIGNLSGYYIFYREKDGPVGEWNAEGVPMLNSTSFTLGDLKAFTSYRIRMTLAVKTGNGPASEEVVNKTIEGVPSAAPKNLVITAIKPTQIYVQWKGIEYAEFNGRQLGYIVKYKPYFAPQFAEKKAPLEILETYIYDLKPFTLYTLEVSAYSGGGYGPPVVGNIKTPEGAPSVAPGSFKVRQGFSTSKLEVSWSAISDDAANGILLGYKLKYTITHVSGQPIVGAQTHKEFLLDKFTLFYTFTGLQSYTTYSVSVSGYTGGGEGPDTAPISATTCKCPPHVLANWYQNPPYVSKGVGLTMSGFMPSLILNMISSSCGTCGNRASEVLHFQSLSGESPMKSSQGMVKKAIGDEYHISYPIFGSSSIRNYMDKHIFILLIQSAGSATVVKNVVDHSSTTMNVVYSIVNIWPMYLIVVCLTSLVGIFIWFMERGENEEFSRGNYVFGIFQGFWWAFISMTTVGYGDITPRTFRGRLVAILWTLAGLVLTGILTGSLTSSVTSLTIPPTATLYNTQSAAINNSFEYNLAVRRNSRVNTKRNYETNEQVLNAVRDKEVEIALLDGFTVAGMSEEISAKMLKISGIINSNNGYGIVLSNEFVRMEQEFRSFIASRQELISSFKANMTEKLQNAQSSEVDQIPLLFDPSTSIFWDMIFGECIMIAIASTLGIAFSFYRSKKRKNKVISKAAAYLIQLELVDAMVTDFQESLSDKLESVSKKHGDETAELFRLKQSYQRLLKRYQVADRPGHHPKKDDFFNLKAMGIGDSTA